MIAFLSRLVRRVLGDTHDSAWKPTGLKFTTGRDYLERQAFQKAKDARKRSATGRKYPRPAIHKPVAKVVSIDSARRAK